MSNNLVVTRSLSSSSQEITVPSSFRREILSKVTWIAFHVLTLGIPLVVSKVYASFAPKTTDLETLILAGKNFPKECVEALVSSKAKLQERVGNQALTAEQAVDALEAIACELNGRVSLLGESRESLVVLRALFQVAYTLGMLYQTSDLLPTMYHYIRGGIVIREGKVFEVKPYFESRRYYTPGTVENEWNTLYNHYCNQLVLDSEERSHLITPDCGKGYFVPAIGALLSAAY